MPKLRLPYLVVFMLLSSMCAAAAQTAGPDEAIGTRGGRIKQKLSLTPAQKNAIYNAVMRQKMPTASRGVTAEVGAPVLPSIPLSDLPSSIVMDDTKAGVLKYATVESDVIVVDPIEMRVVDVIHGGMTP